jgi:hypothetical protein
MPVEVVGFQSAIPAGLPMFAALPRMRAGHQDHLQHDRLRIVSLSLRINA